MKKITILVGLGLVITAGFVVVRSGRQTENRPSSSELAVAPQPTSTESGLAQGVVESTSAPQVVEPPKVQEALPAPENSTPLPEPLPPTVDDLPVVVPPTQPVADFLIAVRDLTDQIQMSDEETAALSAFGNSDQLLPEAILTSLEAKARQGISETEKLADLSETAEIKASLSQLYSSQLDFYKIYRDQNGANEPVDLKELILQWYAIGVKCDELRADLHQKYGLGRL